MQRFEGAERVLQVRSIPRVLAVGQEVATTSRKVREGSVWQGGNDQRVE